MATTPTRYLVTGTNEVVELRFSDARGCAVRGPPDLDGQPRLGARRGSGDR